MRFKRTFTLLVLLSLLITSSFVGVIPVSAAYDYLFPVNNGGKIAYKYGYSDSYGSFHVGIDIHASAGDDTIYAAYSGVVGATADSCPHVSIYPTKCEHYSTFGNYIRINQDDGTYAFYGHLKQYSLLVKVGDRVVKGQPIATMGSSGYSTGKHLHFEVRTVRSDTSSTINVNSVELGGAVNYTYTGYGATSEYTYADIADGVYYLKNSNGKYMSVLDAVEADGQNVIASDFSEQKSFQIEFTKVANGYELRPLCAENSVVNNYGYTVEDGNNVTLWQITNHASQQWNFESVEGGYAIRSAMNPECCIAVNEENNVVISTYTGAENQIWSIENTVSYNANGGTDEPYMQLKQYGEKINLSSELPARDGYFFLGWATEQDAEFATYPAGSAFVNDENTAFYAVWKQLNGELGENIAFEAPYVVSGSGAGFGDYTANLTDGLHYENMAYDNNWFAFYYSAEATADKVNAPEGVGSVIIDLGDSYSLNAVNLHLINAQHASVAMPESVNVYLSNDGEEYTSAGAVTLNDSEPNAYWSLAEIEGNARYVKLEFKLADFFAFVNEIQVYGTEIKALGDVNLDGVIDQYDYILVKRHYFETRYLTDDEFVRADVNADGTVDQFDYILIARHYFGTYVIG